MIEVWYTDKVSQGSGNGRKLGFPTINLNPSRFINELKNGVYACQVEYEKKVYLGALYFGPRFINKKKEYILEIYIIDFNKSIYGKSIKFSIGEFIREPIKTTDIKVLINQIEKDVRKIKSL